MNMARIATPLCFALFALLMLPTASARSGKLWNEKKRQVTALAQVPDFSALAAKGMPAVVSVSVEQRVRMSSHRGRSYQDPFEYFHRFFGPGAPGGQAAPHGRERVNRGIGTGFVISQEGLILTNNHVVENADKINVTFLSEDGIEKTVEARVLGTAPRYDVALLETVEKVSAPISYLGDSDDIRIGDWVMAIGNPFGLSHSVSVGIISAKDRRDIAPSGRHGFYNFLQTDASINPGNSGGPLMNMRGEVIGINTAINAAGSGIGFAIPINMVKEMLPDLKAKGRYARSWIGIHIQQLTDDLAQSYGLKEATGALVAEVVPDGPADKAGLMEGDVVIQFNGKVVRNSRDLPLFAGLIGVGKTVPLTVIRGLKRKKLSITLGEFPKKDTGISQNEKEPMTGKNAIGLRVSDMTDQLRQQFKLKRSQGVVIKEVQPQTPAARAGLQPGDIVLKLNGRPVAKARDFVGAFKAIGSGKVVRMQIARGASRLYLALRTP